MSLHGFSYTIRDFATNKNGKKIRSITYLQKDTELSKSMTNFRPLSIGETKITDWITSQTPIYRRHPINLNNNITDISQKKRSAKKALKIQNLSLIFVIQTMKFRLPNLKSRSCLSTQSCCILQKATIHQMHPKLWNDIQNSHPEVNHVF